MRSFELSSQEKALASANPGQLQSLVATAQTNIANAQSAADVTTEICKVWSSIRQFVVLAEPLPIVGKYVTILVELLDAICPAASGN